MSDVKGVPGGPAAAAAPAVAPATQEPAAPESERAFDEALAQGDEFNEAQAPETRRAIKRSLGRFAGSKAADRAPSDATGQADRVAPAGGGRGEEREAVAGPSERAPVPSGRTEPVALAGGGRTEGRAAGGGDPSERASAGSGQTARAAPVGVARGEGGGGLARDAVGRALANPSGRAERAEPSGRGRTQGREAIARGGAEGARADSTTAAAEGGPHRIAPPRSGLRDEVRAGVRPLDTTAASNVGSRTTEPARTLGRRNPPTLASGSGRTPNRPDAIASDATGMPSGPAVVPRPRGLASRETGEKQFVGSPAVAGLRNPSHGAPTAPGADTQSPQRPTQGIDEGPVRAPVDEEPALDAIREPEALDPGAAAEVDYMAGMMAAERPASPSSVVPPSDPSPTPEVAATAREVVERILVSVPQSGRSDEVRIGLNASVLDGSSIRIYREAGELRVVFEAPTEESQRFLAENRSVLQQTLAERLPGERVQLGVATPPSGGLDRDDADGRSRQQYVSEDTVEPDESDVRDG